MAPMARGITRQQKDGLYFLDLSTTRSSVTSVNLLSLVEVNPAGLFPLGGATHNLRWSPFTSIMPSVVPDGTKLPVGQMGTFRFLLSPNEGMGLIEPIAKVSRTAERRPGSAQ